MSDAAKIDLGLDTGVFRTPKGKARRKELPFTFVEKSKFALSQRKEKRDILDAKMRKLMRFKI